MKIILWEVSYLGRSLKLQQRYWKSFKWKYNKNESLKPHLSKKERKAMVPVVSRSDTHFNIVCPIARFYFYFDSSGTMNQICAGLIKIFTYLFIYLFIYLFKVE